MAPFPWWAWIVLGAFLAFIELHVPGSYLIWIGLGALVTAAVEGLVGLSIHGQIATFAAASVVACVIGYFTYRKRNRPGPDDDLLNQRNQSMVGARGSVCETFVNGSGKVRLGDTVWLAEGADMSEGTPIVVRSVRGARLLVEAADQASVGVPTPRP
jgi:inner membrane protein